MISRDNFIIVFVSLDVLLFAPPNLMETWLSVFPKRSSTVCGILFDVISARSHAVHNTVDHPGSRAAVFGVGSSGVRLAGVLQGGMGSPRAAVVSNGFPTEPQLRHPLQSERVHRGLFENVNVKQFSAITIYNLGSWCINYILKMLSFTINFKEMTSNTLN